MLRVTTILVLAMMSQSASAEWFKVQTDHFILTIEDSRENAVSYAKRLERFDAALRRLYGVEDDPDHPVRPTSIYLLKADLFMAACRCPGTLGHYGSRVSGPIIFSMQMPKSDAKMKVGSWSSQTVLLHEYTHYFAMAHFPIAYPYWFTEGFAEFNASVAFADDGSITFGYPANYRADALKLGGIGMRGLLAPERFGFKGYTDIYYARGWLLTNYMMLNNNRRSQLGTYLAALNSGDDSLKAGEKAFGDLKQLDDELDRYMAGTLLPPLKVPPSDRPIDVTVTALTPGQAAMIKPYTTYLNGVDRLYRTPVALSGKKVADKYPDDPVVQIEASEMLLFGERYDEADGVLDLASAHGGDEAEIAYRKGLVASARALKSESKDAATWKAVRAWFLKANRANPDHVMPLFLYYTSFISAKQTPSPDAVKALMRAHVLAPGSAPIRYALALRTLLDGDSATARALLQPLAFAPHARIDENFERELIALIDAGKIEEAKTRAANHKED
jgi:hypothetical protein